MFKTAYITQQNSVVPRFSETSLGYNSNRFCSEGNTALS